MAAKKNTKTARDSMGHPVSLASKRAESFDAAAQELEQRRGDGRQGSMKKERAPGRREPT